MKQLSDQFTSNPRKMLLVDGLGAGLTAILLAGLLIPLQPFFGMPRFVLEICSLISALFALYSFSCFFFLKKNWSQFLKIIAVWNILYCCLTAFFVSYYFEKLTVLGLCYFLLEMGIIAALVYLELKTVRSSKSYSDNT